MDFVKSLGLVAINPSLSIPVVESAEKIIVPPFLKPGSLIGITSPAGYISTADIEPCMRWLENWGFEVKVGASVGKQWNTFGGTDEERLADLQEMINNNRMDAIMCARGGYGMVRIIDRIDFSPLRNHPKWLLGFSDITVLHAHLQSVVGVASIHCKMCNSFPADMQLASDEQIRSIDSIRNCLVGKSSYQFPYSSFNKTGNCEGILVGGNLRTLVSLSGSVSDINTDGKILFLEDTGEYLYSIDRMFWNLARSGKLSKLKGLLIGGIKTKPDDPGEEFGMPVEEIILEKLKQYDYPVAFNLPVGHQKANVALKCGVNYRMSVTDSYTDLTEI